MNLTDDLKDILRTCLSDLSFHEKFFFPDVFSSPHNSMHAKIQEALESDARKIVIAAPRGVGKTSRMRTGYATQQILFRLRKFLVYITKSGENSITQTENLKRDLLSNVKIRKLFGSVKSRDGLEGLEGLMDDFEESFSKKIWAAYDTLILPRGRGQQVRGLLYKADRPDLILIDDLEDPEMVESELYRKKLKEWFTADVEKCVSRYDRNYRMVYIDTLKHEDSLLQMLIDSSDWESLVLEACDGDLNPTAPDYMDAIEIRREYESHKEKGMLDVFFREFRNLPISTDDPVFAPENFRHVRDHGDEYLVVEQVKDENGNFRWMPVAGTSPIKKRNITAVVIVDPAKTLKLHSAESAIVCFGINQKDRHLLLLDVVSGKFYPDELYDKMFEMVKFHRARVLAVEVTSLHQFISQPIENEIKGRGIPVEYLELNAVGKKEERVKMLAPLYRQHYIYHDIRCAAKLETQLLGFPRSKYWDVMDAAAYIVKLMDELWIYFDPYDDYEDPEDEYAELDYEEPHQYRSLA